MAQGPCGRGREGAWSAAAAGSLQVLERAAEGLPAAVTQAFLPGRRRERAKEPTWCGRLAPRFVRDDSVTAEVTESSARAGPERPAWSRAAVRGALYELRRESPGALGRRRGYVPGGHVTAAQPARREDAGLHFLRLLASPPGLLARTCLPWV